MKGVSATSVPMFMLLLSASLFTVQSIGIANAFSQEVKQSVDDLSAVSETTQRSNNFYYDFVISGAAYSINQKTLELGREGGGLNWTEDNLDMETTAMTYLDYHVDRYLHENYVSRGTGGTNCDFQDVGFNIIQPMHEYALNSSHFTARMRANTSQVSTDCKFDDSETFLRSGEETYYAKYNASYNRYPQLLDAQTRFHKQLRYKLNKMGDGSRPTVTVDYVGPSCGVWAEEPEDARAQLKEKASDKIEEAAEEIDLELPDGIERTSFIADVKVEDLEQEGKFDGACCESKTTCDSPTGSAFARGGGFGGASAAAGDSGGDDGGSTSDDDDDDDDDDDCTTVCLEWEKGIEVSAEIVYTTTRTTYEDTKFRVLTKDGWERLSFRVSSYRHDFEEGQSETLADYDEFGEYNRTLYSEISREKAEEIITRSGFEPLESDAFTRLADEENVPSSALTVWEDSGGNNHYNYQLPEISETSEYGSYPSTGAAIIGTAGKPTVSPDIIEQCREDGISGYECMRENVADSSVVESAEESFSNDDTINIGFLYDPLVGTTESGLTVSEYALEEQKVFNRKATTSQLR